MAQPFDIPDAAIGACLNCRQVFLVTPGSANCLLCGRAPDLVMPFPTAHPEPVEAPEEPPAPADGEAPEYIPSTMTGLDILLDGISAYLAGAGITEDDIVTGFLYIGTDPETAATAVGRLVAVRELIAQLASAPRVTSAVLEEPAPPLAAPEPVLLPPLPPEPEDPHSALSDSEYLEQIAGLGPSPAEQDRTTVVSP